MPLALTLLIYQAIELMCAHYASAQMIRYLPLRLMVIIRNSHKLSLQILSLQINANFKGHSKSGI